MSSQKSKTFARNSLKTFSIGDNIEIGKQTENDNQKEIIKDFTDNKEYININNTIGDGKDLQSSGRSQRREYINKSDIFKEDREKFVRHELHKKIIRDLYNFDTQAKQEKLEQVKRYLNDENFDHYYNILTQKQLQTKTSFNQVTNSTVVNSPIETPKESFFYYQNKLNCIKAEQPIQYNENKVSVETKIIKHKQLGSVPEFNRPENQKTFRKFINERHQQQQQQIHLQQGQQYKAIRVPQQLQNKDSQNNESEIEIISNRTYRKDQPDLQIRYKNLEYGKSKDRKKSESSKEKEDRKPKSANNNSYRLDINDGKNSIINSSKSSFISSNYSISLPKIPSSIKTDSKLEKVRKYIKETKKCPKIFQQLEKIDENEIQKNFLENKTKNKKEKYKNGYDRVVQSLQEHSHEFRKLQYETIKQSVQHLEQLDNLTQKSFVSI